MLQIYQQSKSEYIKTVRVMDPPPPHLPHTLLYTGSSPTYPCSFLILDLNNQYYDNNKNQTLVLNFLGWLWILNILARLGHMYSFPPFHSIQSHTLYWNVIFYYLLNWQILIINATNWKHFWLYAFKSECSIYSQWGRALPVAHTEIPPTFCSTFS